jgi:phosphoglycerate dehydrogenase-like enzyme
MKPKAIFLCNDKKSFNRVFAPCVTERIHALCDCSALMTQGEIEGNPDFARDAQFIFSTWGMPKLSAEEVKKYFPSLKVVFYGAGSVQAFARPFLECGVKVVSAWRANAVPVAEFTFAQIILAAKGYFTASKKAKLNRLGAHLRWQNSPGNYGSKVGLLGVGEIGSLVAERLKTINCEVLAYDPFLSDEKALTLNVRKAGIEEVFSACDVISNHLADKDELKGLIDYRLLRTMKKTAVFINTGRGRQVKEGALFRAMAFTKRAALLDVTYPEIPLPFNPMLYLRNIIISPHMAGSGGNEVIRMGAYVADELVRFINGEQLMHEVTPEMLETMA